MKRIAWIIVILAPYLSQCQDLPLWVNSPPESSSKYYAVGGGTSVSADISERKARLDANVKLAEQVEPVVETTVSRIDSVVRGNEVLVERVTIIRKKVMATLQNVTETEKVTLENNGKYTTYVLLSMPKESIANSLLNQIKHDDDLHKALTRTSVYKELLNKVE
ncbi:MAG: LPP20 family lipoprotein [Perlabentimonas sp.]